MMRPSESPFDRLGTSSPQQAPSVREVELIQGATIFALAHQSLGEWRRWRELLEVSGVEDGFDLEGHRYPDSLALLTTTALLDGSGYIPLDLTAALGVRLKLEQVAGAVSGAWALVVEDLTWGSYALRLRAASGALGPQVVIMDEDFVGADGSPRAVHVELVSADGASRLALTMDREAWLVLWLARSLTIQLEPSATRSRLLAPVEAVR